MSDNDDCRLRRICKAYVSKLYSTALGHLFISSSLLKEVARLHGDLDGLVTASVARAIQAKLAREK